MRADPAAELAETRVLPFLWPGLLAWEVLKFLIHTD